MKHTLILFIAFSFFITSCSVKKLRHDVINDFLEVELKDFKYDSIHVQKEPLDNIQTLKLYEQAYKERYKQNTETAEVWTIPELKEWGFDEIQIIELKKKLKNNINKSWGKDDFENINFVYKKDSELKDVNMIVNHLNAGSKEFSLKLSRPLISKNRKYALFQFHLTSFTIGYASTPNRETIIMKKENGKWVLLSNIRQAAY